VRDRATVPRVYVGGPLRAPTLWEYTANVRRAEALGMEVARMGAVPVLVHTMYERYLHLPESFWTEACQSILSTCHVLVVNVPFDQYERSQGTTDEVRWSVEDGRPIFFDEHIFSLAMRIGPDGQELRTVRNFGSGKSLEDWVARWTAERARDRRIAAEVGDVLDKEKRGDG
jgi:hypothetical protein